VLGQLVQDAMHDAVVAVVCGKLAQSPVDVFDRLGVGL